MFGAVIYRNLAVSQKMTNCKEKLPIVLNLTENIDEVECFFNDNKTIGGGVKYANDWSSGYDAILNQINWNKKSEKIVIHICETPSLGKDFTIKFEWFQKYIKTPKFDKDKSFKQNMQIFKEIQENQKKILCSCIQKLARQGIQFYCLNGNEKTLYCFNKVSSLYLKNGGQKFIIKNLFGYSAENDDEAIDSELLNDEIKKFFEKVIQNSVLFKKSESQFENECKNDFTNDLINFYDENDEEYTKEENNIFNVPFDFKHFIDNDDSDSNSDSDDDI